MYIRSVNTVNYIGSYCLFLNSKSKNLAFITIFDIVVFVIFASFVCI